MKARRNLIQICLLGALLLPEPASRAQLRFMINFFLSLILATIFCFAPSAFSSFWVTSSLLHVPRYVHTATLLLNGKVLAVGDVSGFTMISSAELNDPAIKIWTATLSVTTNRIWHTVNLRPYG